MSTARRPADPAQLRGIVEQQLSCATALLDTLERERQALLGGSIELLERASEDKLAAASTLQSLGAALERAGAGPAQIEKIIVQPSADAALGERWRELLSVAARCQAANLGNGALLDERQSQLRRNQRALRGFQPASTYGRAGDALPPAERRRLASA